MATLNRAAAEVLAGFDVHALTDITGFGLLGHLRNMTAASGVTARVFAGAVPVLPAAREYVQAGIAPGGTHANWKFLGEWVTFDAALPKEEQLLLCDAQNVGRLAGERASRGCGTACGGVAGCGRRGWGGGGHD